MLPDYDPATFEHFKFPPFAEVRQDQLNVIFAGRVERDKGVFDILTMAEDLAQREGPRVQFHIHGEGGALAPLKDAVARSAYGDRVTIHGFTSGTEMARHYMDSDIIIVPTRSTFEEGVAKSVVEGVLSLRPVVTSIACPSIGMLADACVEAQVNNPASYADAIWRLANDPALVRKKVEAATRLRTMFFDPPERYDRQLRNALAAAEA